MGVQSTKLDVPSGWILGSKRTLVTYYGFWISLTIPPFILVRLGNSCRQGKLKHNISAARFVPCNSFQGLEKLF
jgi:hypothetical protein